MREPWCDAPDAEDDERELMGLWMSRLMFGRLVAPELQPFCAEDRSFEQFLADHRRDANSHSVPQDRGN